MDYSSINKRHYYIIKRLQQAPATAEDIFKYVEEQMEVLVESGVYLEEGRLDGLTLKTFSRDLKKIKQNQTIEIVYDRSIRAYKIADEVDEEMKKRTLEAYESVQLLGLNTELIKRISFENRKSSGIENLTEINNAILRSVELEFRHLKYASNEHSHRRVKPLALKESNGFWYLIAEDTKDQKVKTFGLDRISRVKLSKTKFEQTTDFSVEDYLKYSFGIITAENEEYAEEVVFACSSNKANYIKAKPLHSSQKELKSIDGRKCYSIKVYITIDLENEVMMHSPELEILQPLSFRKRIKERLAESLGIYS